MDPLQLTYYPLSSYGPLMKGLIIGGLGIFHVFMAQFAIGGGFLMCYFQWLAMTGRSTHARHFLDSYFRVLVLLSFVLGAVTGVGMWFTSIQISPRTIGVMIDEFHWLWATEWTFFCLEVVAGYAFYRYARVLNDRARMTLLVLYSVAAWMSLFWINGILSWQLTPGGWLTGGGLWAGFFNASFWPSLFYRTVASLTIASLAACIVINTLETSREARAELIRKAAHLLLPIVAMPVMGIWYLLAIPEDSRSWVLGGSATMTIFLNLTVAMSVLVGGYAVVGLVRQKLYINGATATLLTVLAFFATAGGEFIREGTRKPFTIREYLYSNSITQDELQYMRKVGSVTYDPYPLRQGLTPEQPQLVLGAKVFRKQCSVCHTMDGVNGLNHLTGTWRPDQKRMMIAKLQLTKPFMPPFAGTAEELEALVQYLEWHQADQPSEWAAAVSEEDDPVLKRIQAWLDEAGTKPGYLQDPESEDAAAEVDRMPRS